jgi:hypothetical protein
MIVVIWHSWSGISKTTLDSEDPDAGLASLTKGETTTMVHYARDRSAQFSLIRLEEPDQRELHQRPVARPADRVMLARWRGDSCFSPDRPSQGHAEKNR